MSKVHKMVLGEHWSVISRVVPAAVASKVRLAWRVTVETARATAELTTSSTAATPSTSNHRRAIPEPVSGLF